MKYYKVAESFLSINGEGKKAGQLATFIRFTGCNLNCTYCDTTWASVPGVSFVPMTKEEIYQIICDHGTRNVTLTGGEPLLQEGIADLIGYLLRDETLLIEIETNGSVDLAPYRRFGDRLSMTLDYKLPESGMETKMFLPNFENIQKKDTVKFVSGSRDDLMRAKEIMDRYQLISKCSCYISPVFGKLEPADIVEFMKENKMNGVTLQIQMHKIIWNPDRKGV